jgi:hypothetical protein
MSEENSSHSRLSDKGRVQLDERRSRQAEALRENLRKRKAQMRSRIDPPAPAETPGQFDAAAASRSAGDDVES